MKALRIVRNDGHRRYAAGARACGLLFLGLLSHAPARAAWELVPELSIGADTTENPRLDPDTTGSSTATSATLIAGANIATFNERGSLSFTPTLVSYRYSGEENSDLESDDAYFASRGEYGWRTVTAGFTGSYARERILSAELLDVDQDPDIENPDTGDTGRLAFISEKRENFRASPYVSFQVSERNAIRLEVTKSGSDFSGGDRTFRSGFDRTRFSAGINRNVDERNLVSATMAVETFNSDGTQNTTDTVRIEGAFTRPLTRLWTLNVAAGVLRSDFEFQAGNQQLTDSATTDYTMRLGLRKRAERSRMNLDFRRDVAPNASGFAVVRREFRMYYDRALTQRLSARFGARLNETKSLGGVNFTNDREFTRAEVSFEWALKPVLFLEAGYGFLAQDFTADPTLPKTDSNSISIGMNYRGLSRRR